MAISGGRAGGPANNAAIAQAPGAEIDAKENNVVLSERDIEMLSIHDLKRSYVMLGKEFKNKANTV